MNRFALPLLLVPLTASAYAQGVFINEIRIDQPSNDNDEYFELRHFGAGDAGGVTTIPLDDLSYIVIGDGSAAQGSGVIENVTPLTGQVIPEDGYFVAAESTFTIGVADFVTTLNFENGDNVTHMLVRDFTGASGDDLDTDDDGVFDVTPWTQIVDCVAMIAVVGSGELVYCTTTVGPDGGFVPGHILDGCDGGWQIGAFDPVGGNDSPGLENSDFCPFYGFFTCNPTPNSTGFPGVLGQVTDNTAGAAIDFGVSSCPPGEMGFFFAARNLGSVVNPGGSMGVLCAVSNTARFTGSIGQIDMNGMYTATLDTSMMPNTPTVSAMAGEIWHFQFWHRDGSSSNFTNSLTLLFE